MGDGAKVQENLLSISWHDSAWIPVLNQERNQDQRLFYFELKPGMRIRNFFHGSGSDLNSN